MSLLPFLTNDEDGDSFGEIDFENKEIHLALFVKILDYWRPTDTWEQEYTFYHELVHLFQNEVGMELDEKQADSWGRMFNDFIESVYE